MKRVTIADVAKHAGVSCATVSRALNQKDLVNSATYSRILAAIQELGYRPEESVARFSASAISRLILVDIPTLENPFYGEIIFGIETIAHRRDYHIIINSAGFKNLLDLCREIKIGGIVTFCSYSSAQLDLLSNLCTCVQCCEFCKDYPLPYVSINDYEATKSALYFLYSSGRRKISFINVSDSYKFALERRRAFDDFMAEKNLPPKKEFLLSLSNFDYQLAVATIKSMLAGPERPDAIFAISDVFACGAIKAAVSLGINVPQELSVIGFDDLPLGEMVTPAITSIKQPRFKMGTMACEILLEKIRNPEAPNKQCTLDTELIIRESTPK